MFSLIGRIFNLVSGIFGEQVGELEWKKPKTVLKNALDKKRIALEKFYNAVAELSSLQDNQKKTLENNQKKLEEIEKQIFYALKTGNKEKCVRLIMKKNQIQQIVDNYFILISKREKEIYDAKRKLSEAQREVEMFESQRISISTEIEALQAQKNIKEINSILFENKDMEAYNELKKKVDLEKNKLILFDEINGFEMQNDNSEYLTALDEFEKMQTIAISYNQNNS